MIFEWTTGWARGTLFALATLLASLVAFLASLPVVRFLFPYLASNGFPVDRQLAFGQLFVGFLALSLAGGLGFIAVQQFIAARQSVQQGEVTIREERQARVAADTKHSREVLNALFLELHHNRLTALDYEHRLEVIGPSPRTRTFSTRMLEALAAGPMWTAPGITSLLPSISAAYEDTADLAKVVNPSRWFPIGLGGACAAVFMPDTLGAARRRWPWDRHQQHLRLSRGHLVWALAALTLLGIAAANRYAFASGLATRSRTSIETALAEIYKEIEHGKEIDWAEQDELLAARVRILPVSAPTQLDKLLGWFGQWLGKQLRL